MHGFAKFYVIFMATALASVPALTWARPALSNLRCEYQKDPLGIDASTPRLSWNIESAERGVRQAAYEVQVASSSDLLAADRPDLWNSGKTKNDRPFNVEYAGRRLTSGMKCAWRVRIFDDRGERSAWSRPATFEMGLLRRTDWLGQWINDGKASPKSDADFYKEDPAPLFRKVFELNQPVKSARLYIAGLGYYEASLNGRKVGDHMLDPGWTKYGTRVYYATYDVTDQVHEGHNCIGVVLGNGWYNPLPMRLFGSFDLRDHLDVGRPRFIAQLNVEFANGTTESIASDNDWRVGEGEIRSDNIYLGVKIDANREQPGWNKAGFDDSSWRTPGLATEPIGELQSQPIPPIRVTERSVPVQITEPKPGVFIYDFGHEFAGLITLRLRANQGDRIEFRYGELLYPDGSLNPMTSVAGQIKGTRTTKDGLTESVGGPGAPSIAWQADTYIAKGGGEETFAPRFTFHAFRYVEVTGLKEAPKLSAMIGLRMNSDIESAGEFTCSNDMFNQIQVMCRRTFLCNLFSVQSDCPARERLGYGGDIAATCEALMMNFDMSRFYAKTTQDFADAARPDGMLTDTAPFMGIQYCGVGWAMAHPTLVTQLLRYYGNRRLMLDEYDTAKRWLNLVEAKYPKGIVTEGLSDHEGLEPNPAPAMVTPLYYQSVRMLQSMAGRLNRIADVPYFEELGNEIKAAYQTSIIDPSTGKVGPGTQASQSFAIYSGLVPSSSRSTVWNYLLNKIRVDAKGHLDTGIFATKFMLDELCRNGYAEDAYRIVDQPDFPGWGWMLENGATTLWEHWAKDDNTFSHCHPMFGSVSQWFYNWLGGIQTSPDAVGFDSIVIRPQFVKELSWVRSSHACMYGGIISNWRRESGKIKLEVTIPVGTTAKVYLPSQPIERITEGPDPIAEAKGIERVADDDGSLCFQVGSGHYEFHLSG